jgi:hypothetical protein
MSDVATYAVVGGFFAIFIALEIAMLITNQKRMPHAPFEKAYKDAHDDPHEWLGTLLTFGTADIISWFWLGPRIPFRFFLFVLLCFNIMGVLLALVEYQSTRLARKRVKELELQLGKEVGEPSPSEKE